jgi:hypothetical protein
MSHREYVANSWTAITPHDTNTVQCNGIYVGGAGDVRLIAADGSDETFTGVLAGSILPVFGPTVIHTDSTATLMLALRSV